MISFSSKSLAWIGLLTSIVGDDPWAIVARPACTASRQDMARDTLQTQIASGEYDFSPVEGNGEVLSAPNRSQELRSRVSAGGIQLFPRSTAADGKGAPWTLGVRTRSLLRGSSEFALSIPEVAVLGGRATLDHGPFVEWFENRPGGIQQGWIIERRPTGDGELRIVVELEGGFEARIEDQGRSAVFECAGFTLPYRDLRAWDADGRDLPARIVGGGRRIEIEVEDEGASYPLTIDPVLSWMAEGNQAGAGLGISVSSAGDVNGDGYDDVIAGAWHYDNGQTDEGRVFLFLGSASGLSATYAWSQEGNQASAIYGYSVSSAGDVDDDGDDEILVGAPFYDNGQVDEGRAFLYLGSPTGPSSSADWTAEGDLAGANFGVSVATAGDVDGDDHSDLIVGAYLYANGELQEGQAQVFLSPTGLPSASADWTAESDQAGAQLGNSVATAGDVDKDGFDDVIVGAPAYDNGQTDEGRAWLYMGSGSGLSATPAWMGESDQAFAYFGVSVAKAGDVDGDGFSDVLIGAYKYDNGQSDEGRAYVYVGSAVGLSTSAAWTAEGNQAGAWFAQSARTAGDVNGDGYDEVIVGAFRYDDGESDEGRAFLFSGSASGLAPISAFAPAGEQAGADFGVSVAAAGDVNGDGYSDFVVGASGFDNGQTDEGAAFLYLGEPPPVLYDQKISATAGGFTGTLDAGDRFAVGRGIGDLDGDGIVDMAVGVELDDDGGTDRGAVWILFLNADGTVKAHQKISDTEGGFSGVLDDGDGFGGNLADLGDLNGDGIQDLAVHARYDDDGGTNRGAVWILFLDTDGTVQSEQKISDTEGGFTGALADGDSFGDSECALGDLDGDQVTDMAVGTWATDDAGTDSGSVWILFLNTDGTVKSSPAPVKITEGMGGFGGDLDAADFFGGHVSALGDLDGSGPSVCALAVSAYLDDDAASDAGAFYILFLSSTGTVLSERKITSGSGGFSHTLTAGDGFGIVEYLRSLDDGRVQVAASAILEGALDLGLIWILTIDSTGTVVGSQRIGEAEGNFSGDLDPGDWFYGASSLGDLDGDGRVDMVAGLGQDDDGGTDIGAVWILFLNDGTLAIGANATEWAGGTDSDWTDASNWSNGVPDATKTAIIPDAATTPNDPAITTSSQECSSLWIQAGGSLDISAGANSLGVFGGATVSGTITGTGQLVFPIASTLAGNGTISLTSSPAVKADDDLLVQGGLLTITGTLEVGTVTLFFSQSGSMASSTGDLDLQGRLKIGEALVVHGTLASSATTSSLEVQGSGACITAGQIDVHHDVITTCSLRVENSSNDSTVFNVVEGWPAGVSIDVNGTSTLLTPELVIAGDLVLVKGTFAIGVSGTITVDSILVQDGATLDITGVQTLLKAPATITVQSGGKLVIGQGGELLLETSTNAIAIDGNGTLRLDGVPSNRAAISGYQTNRFELTFDTGAHLQAKGFAFRQMSVSGIVIGMEVDLAAAPYDLRGGLFDLPADGGVLLDIQRATPTQLRYLRFDNSMAATGVENVRTSLASSPITLVNWSGTLASDATTAETFDDDPGETSPPERIVWAPPQESVVQGFTASWGPGLVQTSWQTLTEVDSESFLVQRSPEPPGLFTTAGVKPSVGPSSYVLLDHAASMFGGLRYRLFELLTHGDLRYVGEFLLPSRGIVMSPVIPAPAPPMPPQLLVVGPGGAFPDVPAALQAAAREGRSAPLTLALSSGLHQAFEIGDLGFDVCVVAQPGAIVDAASAPLRIADLPPDRTVELVGLVVDARESTEPALVVEDASGVVLLDGCELRGNAVVPALRLAHASAVAMQGGSIEDELSLERGSRATASGVELRSLELTGQSVLETRGGGGPRTRGEENGAPSPSPSLPIQARVERGSRWTTHAAAPRLGVNGGEATLHADGPGLAWLGASEGLDFHAPRRAQPEGVFLLERSDHASAGAIRRLARGSATWSLGALPPGEGLHLQAFVFDPLTGRICFSDVVRVER